MTKRLILGAATFSIVVTAVIWCAMTMTASARPVGKQAIAEKHETAAGIDILEKTASANLDAINKCPLTNEEIELIALVTMAEAEGECEEGKRLVIDTVLNRVDSEYFPDSVYDVIYQTNAFTSMWNGRVERCSVQDDICRLVKEEFSTRTNSEVVFFTSAGYSVYGTPLFQCGNHYFSKY